MRIALAAAILAAVVATIGCQSGDDHRAPPAPAIAKPADAAVATVASAPPTTPALELLDPGREPRVALRYHVPAGTHAKLDFAVDADVMGEPLPTMTIASEVAIDDVLPDGGMRLRITIADLTAHDRGRDGAAAMLAAQLAMLKQLVMTATLSPTGALREPHVALPPDAQALADQLGSFTQSFEQLVMPLPDAAVGVGARWRIARTIAQGGMTMVVTSTIEVTALDGDRVSYTQAAQVGGEPQRVTQAGMTIAIDHIGGTGTGTGTIDLATFAIHGDQTTAFSTDMISDGQTMKMDAKMKLTITPR